MGVYDKSNLLEKIAYPLFGKAFEDEISKLTDKELSLIRYNHETYINEILSKYNKITPLNIICIAPPHNLLKIKPTLFENVKFTIMGGGFLKTEDATSGKKIHHFSGYNWGICPGVVKNLLEICQKYHSPMTLISSQIIREENIQITTEFMDKIKLYREKDRLKFFFNKWSNCNLNTKTDNNFYKQLCDPATIYATLFPNKIETIKGNMSIDIYPVNFNYLIKSDGNDFLTFKRVYEDSNEEYSVNLVVKFKENINVLLDNILNPLLYTFANL